MSSYRQAVRVATVLAFAAGGVDAIGYLTLTRLFTAHMSGNTVAFGVSLGQADLATFVERGVPICIFILGIALGTIVVELEERRAVRHPFVALYCVEIALLASFWVLFANVAPSGSVGVGRGWPFFVLAGLLTLSMGLQNATLRRVGDQSVPTTYVTGLMTSFAEALAHLVVPHRYQTPATRRIAIVLALWGGYIVGAVAASFSQLRWSFGAIALPVIGLAVVIVIDIQQPHEVGEAIQ
jgi:uncharacterized membrane protein YoaK (UPF0700 family)